VLPAVAQNEVAPAHAACETCGVIRSIRGVAGERPVPREGTAAEFTHTQRLMPGDTGAISMAAILTAAKAAGFDGPVTPWADRATLVGRGREKIVKLAGDRLEAAWKEAGLPIVPRWFTPVARDAFGRPLGEESLAAAAE
jgi:hypothetical protein